MRDLNIITIILTIVFFFPIILGVLAPVTRIRLQAAITSFLSNVEFLLGIFTAIVTTNKLLGVIESGNKIGILAYLPDSFKTLAIEQRLIAFLVMIPFVLIICIIIIKIILTPFYKILVELVPNLICSNDGSGFGSRFLGILWKLPNAIILLLIASFALNVYSSFYYNPKINNQINSSPIYSAIDSKIFEPIKNTEWIKKIPVIQGDIFAKENEGNSSKNPNLIERIAGKNIKVIEYFNGVTLDEAVKSNSEIDSLARKITADDETTLKKAKKIYKWITDNISYDDEKAAMLSTNSRGISSGAIIAYNEKKGVCFDYSSLYVAMARAVGLKVRLVTGLGYSGKDWGDHAWNEVYSVEENRWINVDTTFGKHINYFDRKTFNVDHKYAEIQGEW